MLINLTDVLTIEDKIEERQVDIEMNDFCCRLGEFTIIEKTPISLKLSNVGSKKALIEGKAELILIMQCDRCLKDVNQTVRLSFSREVLAPDNEREPLTEEELEEQNFMEGYQLNVESLINNEVFMNWPLKVLCNEDCKGICNQCGKDLNDGECRCDTFVPDPRMAKIKDIFNGK